MIYREMICDNIKRKRYLANRTISMRGWMWEAHDLRNPPSQKDDIKSRWQETKQELYIPVQGGYRRGQDTQSLPVTNEHEDF